MKGRSCIRSALLSTLSLVLLAGTARAQTTGTEVAGTQEAGSREVRPPAVAGSFYPSDPVSLIREVDAHLAAGGEVPGDALRGKAVRAVLVPHAAYRFAGDVAGQVFRRVRGHPYEAVVIMAPSHRVGFRGASIYPGRALATPLGEVPIHLGIARRLAAVDDSIFFSNRGYEREHSVEVQLPFIQRVLPDVPVVPLVVGYQSLELGFHLARTLAAVLEGHDVLLVASSDLSHYHTRSEADWLDRELLALIETDDPFMVGYEVFRGRLEACGAGPILTVLDTARRMGAERVEVVARGDSGEASGDSTHVVGYGGVVVREGTSPRMGLRDREGEVLVELARSTIEAAVSRSVLPALTDLPPRLMEKQGAFVTLRRNGQLRGCFGRVLPNGPLALTVREVAIGSALKDPRFPPVGPSELEDLSVEVSLVSPIRPLEVEEIVDLKMGRDGVMIIRGDRSGLLLPAVAAEQGWDRQTFLERLCTKAGLPPGAWRDPAARLFVFAASPIR